MTSSDKIDIKFCDSCDQAIPDHEIKRARKTLSGEIYCKRCLVVLRRRLAKWGKKKEMHVGWKFAIAFLFLIVVGSVLPETDPTLGSDGKRSAILLVLDDGSLAYPGQRQIAEVNLSTSLLHGKKVQVTGVVGRIGYATWHESRYDEWEAGFKSGVKHSISLWEGAGVHYPEWFGTYIPCEFNVGDPTLKTLKEGMTITVRGVYFSRSHSFRCLHDPVVVPNKD